MDTPRSSIKDRVIWQLGIMVLTFASLVALREGPPEQVAGLVLLLAIGFGWATGRFFKGFKLPAVLGYLVAGTIVGQPLVTFVNRFFPERLAQRALLSASLREQGSFLVAGTLGIAMFWVGRELATKRANEEWRSILGLTFGYLLGGGILMGIVGYLTLQPELFIPTSARLVQDTGDFVGFALSTLGASTLLAGSVLHEQRADGPASRTILRVALLTELAAFVALAVFSARLGEAEPILLLTSPGNLERLVGTLIVGVFAGLIIWTATRGSEASSSLWSVAVSFGVSVAAGSVGFNVPLMMLVAGLIVGRAIPVREEDFLERMLSLSFATLFTFAGTQLPVGLLLPLLPLALGLTLLRGALLLPAAVGAARLFAGPAAGTRYGWAGLIATSIPVAGFLSIGSLEVDTAANPKLTAILWGVATLSGLFAPFLIRAMLVVAQETQATRSNPFTAEALPTTSDGWVKPEVFPSSSLRFQVQELEEELQNVVVELHDGPLHRWRMDAGEYVDGLRRTARRFHHQLRSAYNLPAAERKEAIQQATIEFTDRWRGQILNRAARLRRIRWEPSRLIEILDTIAQSSPEIIEVPPNEDASRTESILSGLMRWVTAGNGFRQVPVRDVVRYHLSGLLPDQLQGLAALHINAEFDLVSETRVLFDRIIDDVSEIPPSMSPDEAFDRIRADLQLLFSEQSASLDDVVTEGAERLAAIFRHSVAHISEDMLRIDTLQLPKRSRGFHGVRAKRELALTTLREGVARGHRAASTRFAALSLELELYTLEIDVRKALFEHGSRLTRRVRGRGFTQVDRVSQAFENTNEALESILDQPEITGPEAASELRAALVPLRRTVQEASDQVEDLREELVRTEALSPLLSELRRSSQDLTECYEVPAGLSVMGSWTLPKTVDTEEVDFRDLVVQRLENTITRNLIDLTRSYAAKSTTLREQIEQTDQLLHFNVELAAAELNLLPQTPIKDDTRGLSKQLTAQGIAPHREILSEALQESSEWKDQIEAKLNETVIGELRTLRNEVSNGRFASLQNPQITPQNDRQFSLASAYRKALNSASDVGQRLLLRLGDERLYQLRSHLGLSPGNHLKRALVPDRFQAPAVSSDIPVAYRRLFSEQALEAGDLLPTRRKHAEQIARLIMTPREGSLRSIAVIGPDGIGINAVLRETLREFKARTVYHHILTSPTSATEVRQWFDRGAHGQVHVIQGLRWLYQMQPGGFEPIRALIDGIAADKGRNMWLLGGSSTCWQFASNVVPLRKVFPMRHPLEPLSTEELMQTMLTRHQLSGFSLALESYPGLDLSSSRGRRALLQWFQAFRNACGGIPRDAMQLWLASVAKVDTLTESVVLGSIPAPPLVALRQLSDENLLTLRLTANQGWIDDKTFVRLFRTSIVDAHAQLAYLVHWGLLQRQDTRHVIPSHLERPLQRILMERGWSA